MREEKFLEEGARTYHRRENCLSVSSSWWVSRASVGARSVVRILSSLLVAWVVRVACWSSLTWLVPSVIVFRPEPCFFRVLAQRALLNCHGSQLQCRRPAQMAAAASRALDLHQLCSILPLRGFLLHLHSDAAGVCPHGLLFDEIAIALRCVRGRAGHAPSATRTAPISKSVFSTAM